MPISYFISDDENGYYHRSLKTAKAIFANNPSPCKLEKHTLTNDCFERAYNGGGGFVEKEEVLMEK